MQADARARERVPLSVSASAHHRGGRASASCAPACEKPCALVCEKKEMFIVLCMPLTAQLNAGVIHNLNGAGDN